MNEEERAFELALLRAREVQNQTAGDGGVHSMDEVLRQLMAGYQPMVGSAVSAAVHPVAC